MKHFTPNRSLLAMYSTIDIVSFGSWAGAIFQLFGCAVTSSKYTMETDVIEGIPIDLSLTELFFQMREIRGIKGC